MHLFVFYANLLMQSKYPRTGISSTGIQLTICQQKSQKNQGSVIILQFGRTKLIVKSLINDNNVGFPNLMPLIAIILVYSYYISRAKYPVYQAIEYSQVPTLRDVTSLNGHLAYPPEISVHFHCSEIARENIIFYFLLATNLFE